MLERVYARRLCELMEATSSVERGRKSWREFMPGDYMSWWKPQVVWREEGKLERVYARRL